MQDEYYTLFQAILNLIEITQQLHQREASLEMVSRQYALLAQCWKSTYKPSPYRIPPVYLPVLVATHARLLLKANRALMGERAECYSTT
jgi:hypothetical protein